jgi:hypothetical protein
MSQFILYRIAKDTRPARAIVAPASLPADTVHRQLRPGERVVWVGNLTDALGLPVTWLDRQREEVLKAVADLRGRAVVAEADPVHDVLARLFLGGQVWREICWKCGKEANPILEHCPHCGADVLPF